MYLLNPILINVRSIGWNSLLIPLLRYSIVLVHKDLYPMLYLIYIHKVIFLLYLSNLHSLLALAMLNMTPLIVKWLPIWHTHIHLTLTFVSSFLVFYLFCIVVVTLHLSLFCLGAMAFVSYFYTNAIILP